MAIELVRGDISHDVVEALLHLHEGASHGHIVGAAYVVLLKGGRRYMTDWCGSVNRMPTHALGAVNVLRSQIEDLILQRDPEDTR